MKNILCLILQLGATFAFCQTDYSKVEITTEQLSDHIYLLYGAGGNLAFLTGEQSTFVVDGQYEPMAKRIQETIRSISDRPIEYMLNTHWHGDHTGGNAMYADAGTTLMAHQNVRKRMREGRSKMAAGREIPPAPAKALPVVTFSDEMELYFEGEPILIFHVHQAHTDGDALVYFPQSNVMHMGDTYFQGRFPFVDVNSGGHIDGYFEAIYRTLFLINDDTKIVPGHGKLSNRRELMQWRDDLMNIRNAVQTGIDVGKSLEEIQEMNPTKGYETMGENWFIDGARFTEAVYRSLVAGRR